MLDPHDQEDYPVEQEDLGLPLNDAVESAVDHDLVSGTLNLGHSEPIDC